MNSTTLKEIPLPKLFGYIVYLTSSMIVSFLIIWGFWKESDIFFNTSLLILSVLFYLTTCASVWYYYYRFKQGKINDLMLAELEQKRKTEESMAKLNLNYRLESMKWEKLQQIVKLIAEQKKPDKKKKEKDLINVPVAKSLIAAIKTIKKEFDTIEPEK